MSICSHMSCYESDIAAREQQRSAGSKRRPRGKEGASGRDVNGGNVPDLLSCGS